MVKIRASCEIIGQRFSPSLFKSLNSTPLLDANEVGEVGKSGIYRGLPTPFGSATIQVSSKAEQDWSRFEDLLGLLESCIEALRTAGAEEIHLSCSLFHDGQCNFGFSKEELKRIATLDVGVAISCYSNEFE